MAGLKRRLGLTSTRRGDAVRLRAPIEDAATGMTFPRVVLGTTNYADQAMSLTRALRDRGRTADHVLYTTSGVLPFGYGHDHVVDLERERWLSSQLRVLDSLLSQDVAVFHFWDHSLVHDYFRAGYGVLSGFDLPTIKASGAAIVYSFTGSLLRLRSVDMEANPHSPYHHGLDLPYDEELQRGYLDYLREWVDCFTVLDPELRQFLPEAEIVPRSIGLADFAFVGAEPTERPLVVHAPSRRQTKGTEYVLRAVEQLEEEGLSLDFKLIEGMDHRKAAKWYRRADIVVDQLLIGWYGVVAVEAMALGKPVIANVREDLASELEAPPPIVSATPDTITDELRRLITAPELRLELAERGRAFVEDVHDAAKVAERAETVYDRFSGAPEGRLGGRGGARFLAAAAAAAESASSAEQGELDELRRTARAHDALVSEVQELRRKAALYDRLDESARESG